MSNFQFVQWSGNLPIDSDRLKSMSENDQYINDILSRAPRGVLSYIIHDDSAGYFPSGTSYFPRFETTFSLDSPRYIKFTLTPSYFVPNIGVTGPQSLSAHLEIDGLIESFYTKHTQNFNPPTGDTFDETYIHPLITIAALNAGSHICKIKIINSASLSPFIGAKFIVQDVGPAEATFGI